MFEHVGAFAISSVEIEEPTSNFRILRRRFMHSNVGDHFHGFRAVDLPPEAKDIDKLQQRWVIRRPNGKLIREEWRDVPIVTE